MQNKYKNVTLGTVEAVFNKLGGMERVESFLRGNVEIMVIKRTIDLGAAPRLPFDSAKVVKHEGTGVVEIELRSDDNLYIDGKKVVLHLSERQMGDKRIVGHDLRKELEGGEQVLLNSNVLDYLCDHPELFPEHWKKNENGETRLIFFWRSIFRDPSDGYLSVRYLCWSDGELYRYYYWLDFGWRRQNPSASVAS
ncbi:MAG: hypothetical protein WD509_00355 [Candidatus Paceibacterota bacterium]